MPTQSKSVPARTAAELSEMAELGDEAKALLAPEVMPRAFIALLQEHELYPDAVRVLAHALPRREAIWWAWVCARRTAGDAPPLAVQGALDATERWITQPTDEYRRAAMEAAEQAGFASPAGCAALAVFLSGGSLAPANVDPVPPGEHVAAKAITGAIVAAAVSSEPEQAPQKFKAFIAQGLDVAERVKLWPA
ncbi:MAG TPA: hypothetical protein VFW98_16235 [Gemmatimonadaceae bacterium]|nr:hypothetical protein [Gemmatimonadaceae bacterium]